MCHGRTFGTLVIQRQGAYLSFGSATEVVHMPLNNPGDFQGGKLSHIESQLAGIYVFVVFPD